MGVEPRDENGNPFGTAANPLRVDPTGTTAQPVTDSVASATGIKKAYDWTGAVTDIAIWTPSSGKKFVVTDIVISCTAACVVTLYDSTDDLTGRLLKGSFAQYGGMVVNLAKPYVSAAANNVLKITTGATGGYLMVKGYEV